jgi:hypothetical protein
VEDQQGEFSVLHHRAARKRIRTLLNPQAARWRIRKLHSTTMKTYKIGRAIAGLTALTCVAVMPIRAETAYFLMSGPIPALSSGNVMPESYVVAVTEPSLIQQARAHLAAGNGPLHLVPQVKITLGADDTNRNYAATGHPPWNWHVTEVMEWTTYDPTLPHPAVYVPSMHTSPSRVASELLGWPELTKPTAEMRLVYFPLTMELSPANGSAVVNVSTRGWVGEGERALIAGFIVQGGEPRNVLIRAIGPSLATFGVVEALADPRLSVFRGTEKIAINDDWKNGNFASALVPDGAQSAAPPPWYMWLYPTNAKESAVLLSLAPGAYTVQVRGANGTSTGVALVEVYDFDRLAPPPPGR